MLQAIEDGLFDLDTDVNDVLPFPVRHPVHPNRTITVRQLLTHTSSIRDNWNLLTAGYVAGDSTMQLRTFLRRYLSPGGADFAPNNFYAFGPGRSYRYANVGADLAAFLVEAAAGTGFDTWCERRIFAPLGMDRAGWHLAGLPRREIAMPYPWAGNKNALRADGALRLPRLPERRAQDDRPATRPASGDGDGWVVPGVVIGCCRRRRSGSCGGIRCPTSSRGRPDLVPSPPRRPVALRPRRRRYGGCDRLLLRPREDVGVVALANGGWRLSRGDYPLYVIMDRLFDAAHRLD